MSPLVGIVTQTLSTTSTTDEACLPNCASELASARRTLGRASGGLRERRPPRAGAGTRCGDRRGARAILGALRPARAQSGSTTAAALGDAAVRPSRFALFHPTQLADPRFPFVEFGEETPTAFVQGISLDDGCAALLPAEIVYLGRPATATLPIAYSTSSGLACAPTFTEAVLARAARGGGARRRHARLEVPPFAAASRLGRTTTSSGRTTSGSSGSPGSRSACSTGAASSTCRSRSQSCTDSRRRARRLRSAQGPQPPSPRPG